MLVWHMSCCWLQVMVQLQACRISWQPCYHPAMRQQEEQPAAVAKEASTYSSSSSCQLLCSGESSTTYSSLHGVQSWRMRSSSLQGKRAKYKVSLNTC